MWNNLTTGQFQLISRVKDASGGHVKLIGILNDMTEAEVLAQTDKWRIKESIKLNFLNTEPPLRAVEKIEVAGRSYLVNYRVKDMPCARYIEVKHFGADIYENLHRLAASMVVPTWEKYNASRHDEYSQDMMDAPFLEVYGSLMKFLGELAKVDQSFPSLWEGGGEITKGGSNFPKIYGWQFQVKQVADHENITLEQAYELPTMQFLNDISYLMAFADFNKTT